MTRRTISFTAVVDAELLTKMQARGLQSPSEYISFLVRHDVPPQAPHTAGLAEVLTRLEVLEAQQHQLIRALDVSQHLRKQSVSRSVEEGHALTRLLLASLRLVRQASVEVSDPLEEP